MDSNYEAQRHFVSQRLAARRDQAAAERKVRAARPQRMGMFPYIFSRLFRRPKRIMRDEPQQPEMVARPATAGRGKR